MANRRSKNALKEWARVVAKVGVLLCEPKVRAAIGQQVKHRVGSAADVVADKYQDAVERLEADSGLRKRRRWSPRVAGLVLCVAAGAGFGILLAPAASNAAGKIREAVS